MSGMITIQMLDAVIDAVWCWEVDRHGMPYGKWAGRTTYEAVMELQEWFISIATK